jgi:hypothetical protein
VTSERSGLALRVEADMAGKQFKSMDIWELLAHRAEIDALIRKKRKDLERAPKTRRTSRTSVRVVTRAGAKPKSRSKKVTRSRRTARAA